MGFHLKGARKLLSQDAIPKNSNFIVSLVLIICMGKFPDASCCIGIIVTFPNPHFSIQVLTFGKKTGDTFVFTMLRLGCRVTEFVRTDLMWAVHPTVAHFINVIELIAYFSLINLFPYL